MPKTMAATGVVNDGPKIKLDNKERVDSFADQSASSSSASNVVQYIAVPASSVGSADGDRILTASTGSGTAQFLLQQFVLSNGQLVVSANSQMPYILPLVRRSSSSSDNVNDGSWWLLCIVSFNICVFLCITFTFFSWIIVRFIESTLFVI